MKSKVIGVLIALAIIGGGFAAYTMSKDDTDSNNNSSTETTSDNKSASDSDAPTFNPLATDNESFRATMEVTSSTEGGDYSGTIERAKDGTLKFSGSQNGENIEFYLLADQSYIACQNDSCFKLTDGNAPIDVNDFNTTEEDIASYKDSATYKGKESCISGTCDVWEYIDAESGNQMVTVYVDTDSNRVVEVRGTDGDGNLKITYEYTDVTITLPENVQELPGGI